MNDKRFEIIYKQGDAYGCLGKEHFPKNYKTK